MDTTNSSIDSIASAEQAASHRRAVLALAGLSLLLQVITFVLMLEWQRRVTAGMESELQLLRTYNQNTRERLGILEERLKWVPPAK